MLSFLKFAISRLFKILFSLEYHGLENVPDSGPIILAGNHPSYLDPVLVSLPIKRTVRFMAWDALFKVPVLGWIIEAFGAFPVDIRRGKGESAYRAALKVLASGQPLGIFPEGQRSDHGPMGELRTGVARLAIEAGAPIVPITIGGASRAWPKWRLLPKPAKIIVRFHKPICLDAAERQARYKDRAYHLEIMETVATSINRSLAPALRGAAGLERWYRQPPSHIRSYEWAPLMAALVATFVAAQRLAGMDGWRSLWLPVALYYFYLMADFLLIKPGRTAKWLRNSMPIWLILLWHYPLTGAVDVPPGQLNALLVAAVLAAFFPFFWESYYALQKFVRGIVAVYYFSLALMLKWPHPVGMLIAVLCFIAAFSLLQRTIYYAATATAMLLASAAALLLTRSASALLLIYAALGVAAIGYLQSFISAAYDIRKAGNVPETTAD